MAAIESTGHGKRRDAGTWLARHRWSYYVILSFAFAVILATALLNYRTIDRELTDVTLMRRAAVAHLAATVPTERFERLVQIAVSLATRPRVHELVTEEKWGEAATYLRHVPKDLPFIERLFLADVKGTLRADVPELPGVRGVDFSGREWYQGVRRDWRPYVSPVYLRMAEPRLNVFAVAVPVRNDGGGVVEQFSEIGAKAGFYWMLVNRTP